MTQEELDAILREDDSPNFEDEFMSGLSFKEASLDGACFRGATLEDVDFSGADLDASDFSGAHLKHANFHDASLFGANLTGAYLRGADLRNADLECANLSKANLRGALLYGARLKYTNMEDARTSYSTFGLHPVCPTEGSFVGWKCARTDPDYERAIIKLLITENAKRSSSTTRKCRCSEAKVLAIYKADGSEIQEAVSKYDSRFKYKVGETVSVPDFDEDRWNECAAGIHFFITKEEAEEYGRM